ncbi:MAG: Ig-like domain-containing protein [Gemmatimonas sp.]
MTATHHSRARRTLATASIALVLVLTACGSGGGDGPSGPPAVTSIAVSPGAVALSGLGSESTVSATLEPSGASGTVSWRSSDPAVATVSGSGTTATVRAIAGGTAQAIATVGSIEGRSTIAVTPVVRSISIGTANATLRTGELVTVIPTITADAGANRSLTWTTSAASIATVSATGDITAVATGTATITVAATAFPSVTATLTVAVVAPTVSAIWIAPNAANITIPATQQLTATVTADAGASTALNWSSSATNIATVSASGLVTPVAPGQATITARSQINTSVSATAAITVTAPAVTVAVTPAAPRIAVGAAQQLTANVTAAAGVATSVTWASSNTSIAAVDANGLVTAVAAGSATITARSTANTNAAGTAAVTVAAPTVTAIAVSPTSASIYSGTTQQLVATVTADAGANSAVTWTSSNTSIASVSATGLVTGVAIGGPVTITAQSQLVPSVSATATVNVVPLVWTSSWATSTIGSGGAISNQRSVYLANGGLSGAILKSGFLGANISPSVGVWISRGAGTNEVTPSGQNANYPSVIAANSATDMMTTRFDNPDYTALRWNGTSFQTIPWPNGPSPNRGPVAIAGAGNGKYFAVSSVGQVWRFDGAAWSAQTSISTGDFNFVSLKAISETVAMGLLCNSATSEMRLVRIEGTTVTDRPVPESATYCSISVTGTSEADLMIKRRTDIARWNGTAWTYQTTTLNGEEQFASLTQCGSNRYAMTNRGRVFSIGASSMTEIGSNGAPAAAQSYGFLGVIDCAPDGTLRAASGNSLLTRYTGTSWIDEHYGPDLGAVSVVNGNYAIAGGDNVIMDWTSSAGWRYRWRSGQLLFLTRSMHADADGSAVFGGSLGDFTPLVLTLSASNSVRIDTLATGNFVSAIWKDAAGNTFAASNANLGSGTNGTIYRRSAGATAWSGVASSTTNITGMSGIGNFALAVSNNNVLRYDGSSWEVLTGPVRPLSKVVTVAAAGAIRAYGGTCQASNDAIFSYNGTTWTEMNTSAVGSIACVVSMWANSPSDVFALVGTTTQRLIHFDGTSWVNVSVPAMTNARAGHGIPGLSFIVGRQGLGRLGLPAAGLRR